MPKDEKMVCPNCKTTSKDSGRLSEKTVKKKVEVMKKADTINYPKIKQDCDCGNNVCYFWTKQTRSADEPETKFYKCVKCGKTWREY